MSDLEDDGDDVEEHGESDEYDDDDDDDDGDVMRKGSDIDYDDEEAITGRLGFTEDAALSADKVRLYSAILHFFDSECHPLYAFDYGSGQLRSPGL